VSHLTADCGVGRSWAEPPAALLECSPLHDSLSRSTKLSGNHHLDDLYCDLTAEIFPARLEAIKGVWTVSYTYVRFWTPNFLLAASPHFVSSTPSPSTYS